MNAGTEMFWEVYGRQKLMVQSEYRSSGRVFQDIEAATGNERRPTVDRQYDGTSSCSVKDDRRRRRPVRLDTGPSWSRYDGIKPYNDRNQDTYYINTYRQLVQTCGILTCSPSHKYWCAPHAPCIRRQNQYINNVCSRCGPGNAHLIYIRQVSLLDLYAAALRRCCCWCLLISAPRLGVYYFFVVDSICKSVCPSVCHGQTSNRFFFFVSRWNLVIFGRHFSISRLVCYVDRICLGLPGAEGPTRAADPCCHGNDIWPRRGDLNAYRLVLLLGRMYVVTGGLIKC